MGVKLFLIRHGQTDGNAQGRYQGSMDTHLTDEGRHQALCAKKYLANVKFSSIYSSNMKRAIETAQIISDGLPHEIKIRENLKEINFGKWEGLKFEEINQKYRSDYQAWLNDPFKSPPTGGESFTDLISRADSEIKKIISENPDGSSVAIITHGGVILALLVSWLKIPPECWRSIIQRQGAINVVVIDRDFPYISSVNYTGHINPVYDDSEDRVIELYSKVKEDR
ncbi:MAG: Phosphoserine phosphatase 1 [Actinobacteria bacterium ADurb.Bin346]|nr:MAG: Phosphoserine phosphatase 1 [Actinobacteria bacterium ADurb.Bin346]